MQEFHSVEELVNAAAEAGKNISELVLEQQAEQMEKSKEEQYKIMTESITVMR